MGFHRPVGFGFVAALAACLAVAGIAFAAVPFLRPSHVAISCVNANLGQNQASHQFAAPTRRSGCAGKGPGRRGVLGHLAVGGSSSGLEPRNVPAAAPTAPDAAAPVTEVALGRPGPGPVIKPPVEVPVEPPGEDPVEWVPPPQPGAVPPETSIVRGPAGKTTSTSATFVLNSSKANSTFDCSLDGSDWETCQPSTLYIELEPGSHEFAARATDEEGNVDATPAEREWTIETPAPPPPPPPKEEVPPPPTECTTTVSSVSAAQSAVSSAAVGSVVCMANGSYGKVTLSATKAAPGVTLRAQNPGGATLESATVAGSHLTLARFVITNGVSIPGNTVAPTIEHNRITGGGQGIDACTTTTTWCTEMRIIGNQLIGPFGEDAIHANRYHGLYVEGNEITQVRENGAHSDCLQTVWRGDHIYFKRNYLHDNRCQGFFIKDQTMSTPEIPGGPIEGVVVEDNLFLRNKEPCGPPATSCGQPIYFQPVAPFTGFVMKRNTIWGDGYDSIAAFRGEGSVGSDTLVENNVIYRIWTDWDMTPATLRNNTDCLREASGAGAFSTVTGETKACSLSFANTAADDYRIAGERGVDWAPTEVRFGP